jgi:hypothetical protein
MPTVYYWIDNQLDLKSKISFFFLAFGQAKELKPPKEGCWTQGQCQGVPLVINPLKPFK